jgi:hypothetical protein
LVRVASLTTLGAVGFVTVGLINRRAAAGFAVTSEPSGVMAPAAHG